MKTADAISQTLKREGVEWIIGYPVNHALEHAAKVDIRPIIVRQGRTGLHNVDAVRSGAHAAVGSRASTRPAARRDRRAST